MTMLFMLSGVTVVAILAAYMVATHWTPEVALAGDHTVVGLSDPASETMTSHRSSSSTIASDWHLTSVNNLTAAEEMLDCLEGRGVVDRELIILGNASFAIRWR
jgi:hypothetical protein